MNHAWMFGISQNWELIEALLLAVALATFLAGGAIILRQQRLQRTKTKQQRGHMRLQSRARRSRVNHFCKVSASIIEDASDLLFRESQMRYEARTMLPLVVEARQLGERLLRDRKKHHVVLWSALEARIEPMIAQLLLIEEEIRAVPRAAFTIEEVVAGRFECVTYGWTEGRQ